MGGERRGKEGEKSPLAPRQVIPSAGEPEGQKKKKGATDVQRRFTFFLLVPIAEKKKGRKKERKEKKREESTDSTRNCSTPCRLLRVAGKEREKKRKRKNVQLHTSASTREERGGIERSGWSSNKTLSSFNRRREQRRREREK